MRKYFLLSAVAMLVATNVNAYAVGEFPVVVYIESAEAIECDIGLAFSAFLADISKPATVKVNPHGLVNGADNVVAARVEVPTCTLTNGTFSNLENLIISGQNMAYEETSIKLVNADNPSDTNIPTISDFEFLLSNGDKSVSIGATFNIPENMQTSTAYTTVINIMYCYE
ncbi:MAG: hypothetical protein IJ019_06150 [Alphaproteobacteria bacterium]|nr:hypothetical protein [Alphaproteobacteria bacterium]